MDVDCIAGAPSDGDGWVLPGRVPRATGALASHEVKAALTAVHPAICARSRRVMKATAAAIVMVPAAASAVSLARFKGFPAV